MGARFIGVGAAAAALALAATAAPAQEPADGAGARKLFEKIRNARRDLRSARARVEVRHTSTYRSPRRQEGTVVWSRTPDGIIRQRWDLRFPLPEPGEDGPEGESTATGSAAIWVVGDRIVYTTGGKTTEDGRLRDPDAFHHPVLGGLVFELPDEEALHDPDFLYVPRTIGTPGEGAGEEGGKSTAPRPGPPAADPADGGDQPAPRRPRIDEPGDDDGEAVRRRPAVRLTPRKKPWTGLLAQAFVAFDETTGLTAAAWYADAFGNEYTLSFSGWEKNPELDPALFDPPAR